MENTIKNTQFDNLVNYDSRIWSNSALHMGPVQSSSDPNSIASMFKNEQLIEFTVIYQKDEFPQSIIQFEKSLT